MSSFEDLGVLPFFIERLKERGITEPLEIQEQVIPLLKNEQVFFHSPTGTGKTFAYLLPVLGKLFDGTETGKPRLLICAPTYELCSQINDEVNFLLRETKYKSALLIGQVSLARQIETLKKDAPLVITGNPGRLNLLLRMGRLKLNDLEYLILDEGDRLVTDELLEETGEFVKLTRQKTNFKNRRVLISSCSATFSKKSRERLILLIGDDVKVLNSPGNILREKMEHWAFFCEERDKPDMLRSLFAALRTGGTAKDTRNGAVSANQKPKVLVFISRARAVGDIVSRLRHHKLNAAGLWGEMSNKSRRQALADFRSGRIRLLVTSDLAARGLDIPDISHVIALDLAEDPDFYIHRAGRTARAGRHGIMVTIGNEAEMHRLAALEKRLGIMVHPKELYMGKIRKPDIDE